MSATVAVAGTCLALGLTYEEMLAVSAILVSTRVPDAIADAYIELAAAIRQVKPSALSEDQR